jgi:NTP pyrophosphatase (non-canonical NTP hydrolase)
MMDDKTYVENVLKTESPVDDAMIKRISNPKTIRALHGIFGLVTEAAEALDNLKRHIYYGKELDLVNIGEECGDTCWYLGLLSDVTGIPIEEIKRKNIEKLKARFGEKFSEEKALNRDLDKERKILED